MWISKLFKILAWEVFFLCLIWIVVSFISVNAHNTVPGDAVTSAWNFFTVFFH